jgi:FixJ family two-component response regulator
MLEKAKELVSIVDDDASVCEATASLLKAHGYRTKSYTSAEEFLNSPPDDETGCLLLDLCLSGASGLEVQRQLASERRRLPIIFITAHGTPETREQALRAGAVAFLAKPFSEESLLNSIRAALEKPANGSDC